MLRGRVRRDGGKLLIALPGEVAVALRVPPDAIT
jgi:hypothetical protein